MLLLRAGQRDAWQQMPSHEMSCLVYNSMQAHPGRRC